jgi:N-methylhydantoinase A/oxoprolinase/acetone carboxylase beta subunit
MAILLGIDTGGTYTDAALLDDGDVYLDTEIIATAVGRPRWAGESRGAEAGHAAAR